MVEGMIVFDKKGCAGLIIPMLLSVLLIAGEGLAVGEEEFDPPEVALGERLFLETRFAQFFFAHARGDANATLPAGDPVVDVTETLGTPLPGPFAGQSMNCRACHLVDEHTGVVGGGNRTYADFARRSPLPAREDGLTHAPRNAPPLVNAFLARRRDFLLHFDGEFATTQDLVKSTFTGRNFGWLPQEQQLAAAHIAHIIRHDNGSGDLAQQFGGPYAVVLTGTEPSIPPEFRLPVRFRIDVRHASDGEILDAVAKLVAAYLQSLVFAQAADGTFNGSPYDVFLHKNGLPGAPAPDESALDYARRLRTLIDRLTTPQFVSAEDGAFTTHEQAFSFGPQELEGLKIFLREPAATPLRPEVVAQGAIGNCIACHAPPHFTDLRFHNTGATQEEYDAIHGPGAFAALKIPDFATRRANPNAYLPATPQHPEAQGPFRSIPAVDRPGQTDLGLWNIYANSDFPRPQWRLERFLCATSRSCRPRALLPKTIALFKTPGLRDLGHAAPYFHSGRESTLEDVVRFYKDIAGLARDGQVRNGAPELVGMALTEGDVLPLSTFLRALNEDYN
jgi:cytochrome c peroxidase